MKKFLLAVPVVAVLLLTACEPAEEGAASGGKAPEPKSASALWAGLSKAEKDKVCKVTLAGDSDGMMEALVDVGLGGDEEMALMVPHVIDKCSAG